MGAEAVKAAIILALAVTLSGCGPGCDYDVQYLKGDEVTAFGKLDGIVVGVRRWSSCRVSYVVVVGGGARVEADAVDLSP